MYRHSWVEIDLDALRFNFRKVKAHTPKEIICVIKADAYGAGDFFVVQAALQEEITSFAVSSLDEALTLRNKGVKEKIIILGFVDVCDIPLCIQHNLIVTITSLQWLKEIITTNPTNLVVHLKLDTGMNRVGIKTLSDAKECLALCLEHKIIPEGIFTHFACSDNHDKKMSHHQFEQFSSIVSELQYPFKSIHTANSDAIFSFEDNLSTAVRLGISMFGISSYRNDLQPVFSLHSKLSCIKEIEAEESVGYGATYVAKEKEIIGTVPIGYADGLNRRNQNRQVWINNTLVPLVGQICMDQCMVKLPQHYPLGTEVEFFGKHIDVTQVAKEIGTIPYEILTGLSERLPRLYLENNTIIQEINARLDYSKKMG
ncbi:MAG: alanine racemase [Anaerorhabdus sp.]